MLPVITSTTYTMPTPLVNTAVPGTAVTHVPYDNVAPSVNSAQIENNTSGNSTLIVSAEEAAPSSQPTETPQAQARNFANGGIGAPATFLAQLMGQDGSDAATTILVQYEKLIQFSNVKYKPSYAFKPTPEPAGVFGKLVQAEKNQPIVQQTAAQPQEAPEQAQLASFVRSAVVNEQAVNTLLANAKTTSGITTNNSNAPAPSRARAAYADSSTRVEREISDPTAELV